MDEVTDMSRYDSIIILTIPGTTETSDSSHMLPTRGMTKFVTDLLPDEVAGVKVETYSLPYPSAYGDKMSYFRSVDTGFMRAVKWLATQTRAYVILVGYSQGAHIAGDLYYDADLVREMAENESVIAQVHTIADPKRSPGHITGDRVEGEGILGSRANAFAANHFTYAAPGDIICTSDTNADLFKELSVFTNAFWIGNILGWVGYAMGVAASPQFQGQLRTQYSGIAGFFRFKRKLERTLFRGGEYIRTSVHTRYMTYKPFGDKCGLTTPQIIAHKIKESLDNEFK